MLMHTQLMASTNQELEALKQDSVLVLGNLSETHKRLLICAIAATIGDELQIIEQAENGPEISVGADIQRSKCRKSHVNPHRPVLLHIDSNLDDICEQLWHNSKLEAALSQQQRQSKSLADDMVRLNTKYQELKTSHQKVLWEYMPQLPAFSAIPILDESIETTESKVSNYVIAETVGKGHFATVSAAACRYGSLDKRELAIKAIDKQRIKNINGLRRIVHEIEALSSLRHPNILSLREVLHGKEAVFLVTERLASDLYEYIGEHPNGVGEEQAKRVIAPIVDAVVYMHSQGYCHRDLKSENVLLEYHGKDLVVKLCDLGLCTKLPCDDSPLTEFCGSPGFLAPEIIIERRYDGRKTDMWSVGCILLELILSAKDFSSLWMRTFQDELLADPPRFQRHLWACWPRLEATLREHVSDLFFTFSTSLLAIDPARRISSKNVAALDMLTPVYSPSSTQESSPISSGTASLPAPPPKHCTSSLGSISSVPTSESRSPIQFHTQTVTPQERADSLDSLGPAFTDFKLVPPSQLDSPKTSQPVSFERFAPDGSCAAAPAIPQPFRPRPYTCKSAHAARSSLRAQTLIKLEQHELVHPLSRARNLPLRARSPGTPDVSSAVCVAKGLVPGSLCTKLLYNTEASVPPSGAGEIAADKQMEQCNSCI